MRLAWFSHRYFPCLGGSENYGRAMVRRFAARGDDVDVVTSNALDLTYFTSRRGSPVEAPGVSHVDGARVIRLPVRHRPFQRYVGKLLSYVPHWQTRCRAGSYMPIIPGIERVRGPYDVVFAVGFPYTLFSLAALRTARAAGAPLVLTPFLHLSTPGDPVHRSYTRPHQIRLLREADLIVAVTDLEARTMASWGIDPARLITLGMGVDHGAVTGGDGAGLRARLGIAADSPVVGQLGALDYNKGTDHLVEAVARLNASRPAERPVHLVLGGPPTPRFRAFVAGLPDSSRGWLHQLGPLPSDRISIADFHAALDLFAMPSRTDSFGIVYLEAWANARPVVAAAAGGVAEVVEHDRDGLLVPFGAVAEIARSIELLITRPEVARRLGATGFAKVSRGYTWDDRFGALAARLDSLLAGRRPLPPPHLPGRVAPRGGNRTRARDFS